MTALHLNLLNPEVEETSSPNDARTRVLLCVLAGFAALFMLLWAAFVSIQLAIIKGKISHVKSAVAREANQAAESTALKAKLVDLQAETEQYAYYAHSRQRRGDLFKRLAYAVPEGVTLSALVLPSPEGLAIRSRPGAASALPPTQPSAVEPAELRLTGLAIREQDVFQMMQALEGNAFTGLVSIVRHPVTGEKESPRVLAFRQEAPTSARRGVFFDIVYDLTQREFVK